MPNSSRTDFRRALRLLLPVALLLVLFATARAQRDAQVPPAAPATASCPGQPAPAPIATGTYTQKPVPDIVINGQPAPGAIWKPGDRSYWHCHTGGQLLMVDSGVGRVQQRGQRARILRRGETEWAGPGVEHWHGADVNESAHFFVDSVDEAKLDGVRLSAALRRHPVRDPGSRTPACEVASKPNSRFRIGLLHRNALLCGRPAIATLDRRSLLVRLTTDRHCESGHDRVPLAEIETVEQ